MSVLIPLLFVVYINNLQDNMKNSMNLYADDSKIIGELKKELCRDSTRHRQSCSMDKNLRMHFNFKKCKVLHVGKQSRTISSKVYLMTDDNRDQEELAETVLKKDLGIVLSNGYFNVKALNYGKHFIRHM